MSILKNKIFVSDIEKICYFSTCIILIHYHGLTAIELTDLRKFLRQNKIYFKVVKNTLCKIALSKIHFVSDVQIFSGPIAIIYSKDEILSAREIVQFTQSYQALKIVGGILNNDVLDSNAIYQLSTLISVDHVRSLFVQTLRFAPMIITKILQNIPLTLINVMKNDVKKI